MSEPRARVALEIDPEIKHELENWASAEDRSISSLIRRMIADHVAARRAAAKAERRGRAA